MTVSKYKPLYVECLQNQEKLLLSYAKVDSNLKRKLEIAQKQYSKFCDDMIRENSYINRLNAAMEREKIRTLKVVIELLHKELNSEEDATS